MFVALAFLCGFVFGLGIYRMRRDRTPKVVEVETTGARRVLAGPVRIRVVTTTMRDVEERR